MKILALSLAAVISLAACTAQDRAKEVHAELTPTPELRGPAEPTNQAPVFIPPVMQDASDYHTAIITSSNGTVSDQYSIGPINGIDKCKARLVYEANRLAEDGWTVTSADCVK